MGENWVGNYGRKDRPNDLHFHNLVRSAHDAVLVRIALLDHIDELHAARDLSPDGVLSVQESRVGEADEELAVGGVRVHRARHRHRPADMRFLVELRVQLFAAAAHARARRIARLRHEAIDDTMEHNAVIEPLTRQFLDPRDMVRRRFRQQFDDNATIFQIQIQRVFLVHLFSSKKLLTTNSLLA